MDDQSRTIATYEVLSANHPGSRLQRSGPPGTYSGYSSFPESEFRNPELEVPPVCLRDSTSNIITETHYRSILPSPYYWSGGYAYPSRNCPYVCDNSFEDERDERMKRRRSPSMAQRRAANIRERKRMLNLNEAFDVLRRRVPTFNYERRLSRIETLRLAMGYISFMTQILNGKDPKDAKINFVKPGVTVKMDKELRENAENHE